MQGKGTTAELQQRWMFIPVAERRTVTWPACRHVPPRLGSSPDVAPWRERTSPLWASPCLSVCRGSCEDTQSAWLGVNFTWGLSTCMTGVIVPTWIQHWPRLGPHQNNNDLRDATLVRSWDHATFQTWSDCIPRQLIKLVKS
jgi:hypothetical protein